MGNDMGNGDVKDGSQVCERAMTLARKGETLQWELAQLLAEIQTQELWRSTGARSFKNFLQDARIGESTARQLIKVRKMCDMHSIPRETMEQCGWSKLAEIAKNITPENKDELLADAQQLSLTELRAKQRQAPKESAKTPKTKQTIVWTEEIQEALRHAAKFTRSNELQVNLEYVAQQFKLLKPYSPDRNIPFSRN